MNPYNRDIFAAGTIAGDLYVWLYNCMDTKEPVKELFADSSRCGTVMGMDFVQLSPHTEDYLLLTCHDDGNVCLWKVGKIVVLDKKVRLFNALKDEPYGLTAICAGYGSSFFLGTLDGTVLGPVTASRTIASDDGKHQDCVTEVFAKQNYTIIRLSKVIYKGTECLLSCDFSSELHFYDLNKMSGKPIIAFRLPLLSDQHSLLYEDYVFVARAGGELKYFKLEDTHNHAVDNNLHGKASCIVINRSQNWLVTGAFEGKFQVFEIAVEERCTKCNTGDH